MTMVKDRPISIMVSISPGDYFRIHPATFNKTQTVTLKRNVSCLICACRPMDRAPVFETGNMGSIPIVRSMNSPL